MTDITHPETLSPPDILTAIEADGDAAVGRAFVALAAEYFSRSRHRDGRVSTIHTPAGLAARFDEPAPRAGHSIDSIVTRLRADVIPDCIIRDTSGIRSRARSPPRCGWNR